MATPATVTRAVQTNIVVPVRVHGVAAAWRTPGMGIAVFAADTGADFVWQPLPSQETAVDGALLVDCQTAATGDVVVTLATERRFARHGYLARLQVRPSLASADRCRPIDLDAHATEVTLEGGPGDATIGPLQLVRIDDPQWLPPLPSATGLAFDRGTRHTLVLGAGDYELRDALTADRAQRFTAPSSQPIKLNASWATSRGDRP